MQTSTAVSFLGERGVGGRAAARSQQMEPPMHIPVFLDRTFRMVEQGPADVVCWSRAGTSFIIKQIRLFEGLLPSYYNHNKFMSFVRQLNFYGFQKVKRKGWSRLRSSAGGGGGGGAQGETEAEEEESWAEFRHPQFRRGRRDLLVGITRQKDSGRVKRKQADARKSDIMSALVADVGMASGELKAVKNKLDSIMSLVFSMEAGKSQASRVCNPTPQSQDCIIRDDGVAAAASEGGSASFGGDAEDGNTASLMASAASTATARCGLGQWPLDGESASGGIRRSGHDPYERGTLFDYRPMPRLSVDRHQHQDWQGHPLYSQLPEEPSPAERYPVAPDQARYDVAQPHSLPPLGAAVDARAPEISSFGPSRQQLPPLHISPPRASEGAMSSPSSERKHGGEGKGDKLPESTPRNRGDGVGGGGGGGGGEPRVYAWRQRQQQQQQLAQRGLMHPSSAPPQHNRETAMNGVVGSHAGGGPCVAAAEQQMMQHGPSG